MSGMIELTAYSGKFLGPIAKVLGWIMSGIYDIVLKISGGTINLSLIHISEPTRHVP